jgi:ribokinase
VVPGANAELTPRDAARLEIARGDIVLAQLEVPPVTVERVFQRARDAGVTTVLNPSPVAPCTPSLLEASDVLVLNEVELAQLTGRALAAEAVTPDAVRALARRHGQLVVVTLGARGALAVRAEEQSVVAGRPVPVVDTTGAGDTFAGALAALLDSRLPLAVCLEGANVAASLSVQRAGAAASSPTRAELEATWQRQW